MKEISVLSNSPSRTRSLARKLTRALIRERPGPWLILLEGDLGAGKTEFVKGIASLFQKEKEILSPTFVIYRKIPLTPPFSYLYHWDLYRLENPTLELQRLGLARQLEDPGSIVVVEWADKAKDYFSAQNFVRVRILSLDEKRRQLQIYYPDKLSALLLKDKTFQSKLSR